MKRALVILAFLLAGCTVTLEARNLVAVPMFDTSFVYLESFPQGTRCTREDNEIVRVMVSEIPVEFYLLKCRGIVGYVNVRFIK